MLPADLDAALGEAWERARSVPGFLSENEARFLGLLAACTPAAGVIVEIGSFKGKSTVALASVAARYAAGPVVSVDPHTAPSRTDPGHGESASSFEEFQAAIRIAGLEEHVEVHRAFSRDVAKNWGRHIRVLWIDGDHTYAGTKEDFDLFSPHLSEGAIVALHDSLHPFEGPIRVFVEEILRSDKFGPAGFCGSIAWAQHRPRNGTQFRAERERLARPAARLIPSVTQGRELKGFAKMRYKLCRALVPRAPVPPAVWLAQVSRGLANSAPRQFGLKN